MGKFKVGDKVRILNTWGIGGAFTEGYKDNEVVTLVGHNGMLAFPGKVTPTPLVIAASEFKYIELVDSKPFKNQRIEALEKRVGELELIVHELRGRKVVEPSTDDTEVIEFKGNKYRKVDRLAREGDVVVLKKETETSNAFEIGKPYKVLKGIKIKSDAEFHHFNAYDLYEDFHYRTPETVDVYELIMEDKPFIPELVKTPNQLRAEIIEKAKGFVEYNGNEYWEFAISEEFKRVLAFNLKVKYNDFGFYQMGDSEVFNEHIGKAIALGRALGLDVSEFEGAVQPTVAIGQVIEVIQANGELTGWLRNVEVINWRGYPSYNNGQYASEYKIINDTNAIYGEVE